MKIVEHFLTRNRCYQAAQQNTKGGLMLHSVGCPQPSAQVFVNSWNSADKSACVHAFIDANTGDVYQTLPWEYRGWHCGSGPNGSGNNTHIGVEMCEPACIRYTDGARFTCSNVEEARAAVRRTYESAVQLFAELCERFRFDPLADGVILSHEEGHKRGIASNHGDPVHLWNQLNMGYTMDEFRKAIKAAMGSAAVPAEPAAVDNAAVIWNFLKSKGLNDYAVAGIMGNLEKESGLDPCNLQNSYNKKLNISDADYTAVVDAGAYPDFVTDKAGYGLVQWTYWSRKKALLDYAKAAGTSIGDLNMQLAFMWQELQGYKAVMTVLNSAASVREASDIVLHKYEQPGDQSVAVEEKRAASGQTFFDRFTGSSVSPFPIVPFLVRVVIPDLNIRTSPGSADNSNLSGKYTGIGTFTIVEISGSWGLLKSYRKKRNGWIYLGNPDYCEICS
ncbi:hypothetical protein IMSAGC003_00304 [Lachnospiraceae bacterium]|nr:hypothetical protein IMSAGC003_00304 [Lachnospiraceae bacterium]